MRILTIEDDAATARAIELMLKSEGFTPITTDLGEEGVDLAKLYDYDAITLDLNLPDMHGLDVLRQIRSAGVRTPVVVLTGASGIDTKVKAFGLGADDYMTKPFHKDELVARLNAVVRRTHGHTSSIIRVGEITINLDLKRVESDGFAIHLTGKEYQLLELLALRKGATVTKEMMLNHLYGGMDEPEIKIVDVFVCKIRKKLLEAAGAHHIETVWGHGYSLVDTPKPDVPGSVHPMGALRSHVMTRLAKGPSVFAGFIADTSFEPVALLSCVRSAYAEGLVGRQGRGGEAVYSLTELGQRWVAQRTPVAA